MTLALLLVMICVVSAIGNRTTLQALNTTELLVVTLQPSVFY